MDWLCSNYQTLLSGLFDSVLTMLFVFVHDYWKQQHLKKMEIQNLAKAIHTEITVLVKLYGKMKLKSSPPLSGADIKAVLISQNYLSVYENNLNKIGILKKKDVTEIIKLYLCFKYLIDSLKYLSQRWETYVQYQRNNHPIQSKKIYDEMNRKYRDVVNAHNAVCEGQSLIFSLYDDVLKRLEKY